MVDLVNISKENIDACLALSPQAWQEKYSKSVAEHLSRAYIEPETLIPLAVQLNKTIIGFLIFRFENNKNRIRIVDIFIDQWMQEKGYGRQTLISFLELAENFENYDKIYSLVDMGNLEARKTFEAAGFMRGIVDIENRLNEMVFILR